MAKTEWDDLFKAATHEPVPTKTQYEKVEVPHSILDVLADARYEGNRIFLPVKNVEDVHRVRALMVSAGPLLTPPASISAVPVDAEGNKVDAEKAVKIRLTVGERRGAKVKNADTV